MTRLTPEQREATFETLFRATYARVLSYARAMTAVAHDADDAVAETYAIAWRRLDDVPAGAELGWLIGVARRVLANNRRGARRAASLRARLGFEPPLAGPDPAERVADDGLREALLALPPLDREALALVAWFDLTPAEAAVALGVGPGTFRMRLARARRRLRAALDPSDDPAFAPPTVMTPKETPQ